MPTLETPSNVEKPAPSLKLPNSSSLPPYWNDVANEESGVRLPEKDGFIIDFNGPVDPKAVISNFSIMNASPIVNGMRVACNDPSGQPNQELILDPFEQLRVGNYLGNPNSLLVTPVNPWLRDCQYKITLNLGPFNSSGQCQKQEFNFSFWVMPDDLGVFDRETTERLKHPETHQLLGFKIKEGVKVPTANFGKRYRAAFGFGPADDLVPVVTGNTPRIPLPSSGPSTSTPSTSKKWVKFQQTYKGIPVENYGLMVEEEDGYVKSAYGRTLQGIKLDTVIPKDTTGATALQTALNTINAQQYSWQWMPDKFSAPKGKLVIFSDNLSKPPIAPTLAWRFIIAAHQPPSHDTVYIDATDGIFFKKYTNFRYAGETSPTKFDPNKIDEYNSETVSSTGMTLYDGLISKDSNDFKATRLFKTGMTTGFILAIEESLGGKLPAIQTFLLRDYSGIPEYFIDDEVEGEPGANEFVTEEQKPAVSVQWAMEKVLQYVDTIFGFQQITERFPMSVLYAYLILDESWKEKPLAVYEPPGVSRYADAMLFNLVKLGFNPGVTPDLVGHEFYHLLNNNASNEVGIRRDVDVEEGFADAFGSLFEFWLRMDRPNAKGKGDWCFALEASQNNACQWSIDEPASNQIPSTYYSDPYNKLEGHCLTDQNFINDLRCLNHFQGMVAAHAIYLMVNGGNGMNELECAYHVTPLDPDAKKAREMAAKILLAVATYQAPPLIGIYEARVATLVAAESLFSGKPQALPNIIKTIEDAWGAVGVYLVKESEVAVYSPEIDKQNVEPWPASIWTDVDAVGTYQLQISSSDDFDKVNTLTRESVVAEALAETLKRAEFTIPLGPNKPYYWRVRKKPDQLSAPWGKCEAVRYFYTASKAPQVLLPKLSGAPQLHEAGQVSAEEIPTTGAWPAEIAISAVSGKVTGYRIGISIKDDLADDGIVSENEPEIQDAYTSSTGSQANIYSKPNLKYNTVYYLYPRAIGPAKDASASGPANIIGDSYLLPDGTPFKFRTSKMPAPVPVLPKLENPAKYKSNEVVFLWRKVPAATSYHIVIYIRNADGTPDNVVKDMPGITGNPSGTEGLNYSFLGPDAQALSTNLNGYLWKISGSLDNVEGNFSDLLYYPVNPPKCVPLAPNTDPKLPVGNVDYINFAFRWQCDYGEEGYAFELFKDGITKVYDVVQSYGGAWPTAGISLGYPHLQPNSNYSWSVSAFYNGIKGPSQFTASFKTKDAPPPPKPPPGGTVGNSTPCDNTDLHEATVNSYRLNNIPLGVVFVWGPVPGAVSYNVQITSIAWGSNSIIATKNGVVGIESPPINFDYSYNGTYIVNVLAVNDCGIPGTIIGLGIGINL